MLKKFTEKQTLFDPERLYIECLSNFEITELEFDVEN